MVSGLEIGKTGFFFFNDTATTEIYTLSLHDALPIFASASSANNCGPDQLHCEAASTCPVPESGGHCAGEPQGDRKSTRLNSSHANISYAVFCLKKKNKNYIHSSDYYHYLHNPIHQNT